MICYNNEEGNFEITLKEYECIYDLCDEKIIEMESDLNSKDPHKYILIKSLYGKIDACIQLMNNKGN